MQFKLNAKVRAAIDIVDGYATIKRGTKGRVIEEGDALVIVDFGKGDEWCVDANELEADT